MNYSEGSLWHKWDLHVHTPCSIVQNYGGDNDAAWDKFITDLESLPSEFKVLGINDYIFLDGYKKVKKYMQEGRIKNIDLILPVIELRLDKFVGTEETWQRINFHVIFSDDISDDTCYTIEDQFLSGLGEAYQLSPEHEHLKWSAKPTRRSLIDLGKMIKESVPKDQLENYGSDLMEGFNALNFNHQKILDKLKNNYYFKEKHFTAIGKTEWDDLKWKQNSIASKKSLINEVDFIFTAAENPSNYNKAKENLKRGGVNYRLLDCSDAHEFSDSSHKDRIGNCSTWIKADTTFEGLRQIKFDEERIYVGEHPEKLQEIKHHPERFINNICIEKKSNCLPNEKWFSSNIALNSSMIAIIGNKGAGKSALIDIIGLLGNSHVAIKHRPFLNKDKFGRHEKWSNFEAKLTWKSNKCESRSLSDGIDTLDKEYVKYIPQNYFEEICNELEEGKENSLFYNELHKVIFSHVPEEDRLGENSLQDIIDLKTKAVNDAIENYKTDLRKKNKKIVELEHSISDKNIQLLRKQIKEKKSQLESIKSIKPKQIQQPELNDETIDFNNQLEEWKNLREEKGKQKIELFGQLSTNKILYSEIENFKQTINSFHEQYLGLLSDLESNYPSIIAQEILPEDMVQIKIDCTKLEKLQEQTQKNIQNHNNEILQIEKDIEKAVGEETKIRENLADEERKYRDNLDALEDWERRIEELKGNATTPDTLVFLEKELDSTQKELPQQLLQEINERNEIVEKIFSKKCALVDEYKNLYSPVHDFIQQQSLGQELGLRFSVSIWLENFYEDFFYYINRNNSGTYYGIEASEILLQNIISKYNLNDKNNVLQMLKDIETSLEKDLREDQNKIKRDKKSQLKQGKKLNDLYDFLFSMEYLQPRYILKLDDKELSQLSPGEKGTMLLIFYLLVDKDKIPLLIDQPEHNLDNETIYKLLVTSVKIAKNNRQLIIVTHNPNLAVVCDAEQIIYASRDAKDGNRIDYISGAIENKEINKKIIDVLEGTIPAFNQRRFKYILNVDR